MYDLVATRALVFVPKTRYLSQWVIRFVNITSGSIGKYTSYSDNTKVQQELMDWQLYLTQTEISLYCTFVLSAQYSSLGCSGGGPVGSSGRPGLSGWQSMAWSGCLGVGQWLTQVVWVWFGDLRSELSGWRYGGLPEVSRCGSSTYQGCLGGGLAAYPSYVGGGSATYYMLIINKMAPILNMLLYL